MMLLPALAAGALLVGSAARAEEEAADAAEAAEAVEAADDGDAEGEQAVRELTTQASEIELGFLFNHVHGNNPFAFGNYTGLIDDQFYVLGNVDIFRRAPWDSDSSEYYRLRGLNLGLDSRFVDAEYGHQGLFGLRFLFDELPVYKTETAQTFFLGAEGTNLTLPATWTALGSLTPAALEAQISDDLQLNDIEWKRRKLGGGASLVLPANLEFDANYLHETKQGSKLMAGVIAENGGDPRSVILPEELDYQTQRFDGTLSYGGENLQLELGYYGSTFGNDNDFLRWQVPFDGAWSPFADYCVDPVANGFCGTGQKGQMPDNWFHQILASGGYNLPHRTRVTLSTAFSWMLQDQGYLPYTVNQNLLVPIPLPHNDLNGEIFTSIVDFGISSRPLEKLRLDAGYRFEDRDNDTDKDVYVYVPSDANDQHLAIDGRNNLPYSLTRQQVTFDAGYQLPLRSELILGYEWEQVERDYQEVSKLWENTLSAILTGRPTSFLSSRISYEHSWRNGSEYKGARPYIEGRTSQFIDAEFLDLTAVGEECEGLTFEQCIWENHPLQRKFYLADLHRDGIRGLVTWVPHEDVSIGVNTSWRRDNYHNTQVGLTEFEYVSPGVDVSYAPLDWLSTYAFYNYQWSRYEQNGWWFGAVTGVPTTRITSAGDPTRQWTSHEKVDTHTVGAGFDLDVIPNRLAFGADYLFAESRGKIDVNPGSLYTTTQTPLFPYPDTLSRQNNVSVHGEYRFTDNFSMRVGYLFAKLTTKDYALDGVTPWSLINCTGNACVIGAGQESPDYTAHVVAWSLVYRFW